jgi:hypothetical protein
MRAGPVERLTGTGVFAIAVAAAFTCCGLFAPSAFAAADETVTAGTREFSGVGLSPQQKLSFAQTTASALDGTIQRILGLVTEAQQRKDVVLLNCLNDKLIALRGLLKVAEDGKLNLQEAIARENLDLQEHNYRKVAIADDQARLIMAEADACVGDLGYSQSGETIVSVTVEGQNQSGDEDFGTPSDSSTRPADSSPGN